MKVIGVYSGKGGVGKSTVASFIAEGISRNHKVALVDLDITTPSIPVLWGNREKVGNLSLYSMGYGSKKMLSYTGNFLRKATRELIEKAKADNPDVIVIDMPPGMTEIHMELVQFCKPSFFVLVVQPSKLTESDAVRASELFTSLGIPIVGVVENMGGTVFGRYKNKSVLGLKRIGAIPLNPEIARNGSAGQIEKHNPLRFLATKLYIMANSAEWEITPKCLYEGPTFKELQDSKYLERHGVLRFIGLKSWEDIRELLIEQQAQMGPPDQWLEACDEPTIRKMLEHLGGNNTGMFMIVKPPNTPIRLFPGEIGMAHLDIGGATSKIKPTHYGVPRIAYPTDQGEVILFPNEIAPVTLAMLQDYMADNTVILAKNSNVPRYLPNPIELEAIGNAFGYNKMGIHEGWKEEYTRLGVSA